MKLICNNKNKECEGCPHSISHEHLENCESDCPDVDNSKCVSEIKHKRKEKLKKLYETR